ncbi:hypothetical protein PISL3812_01531 [Talaromyces islandicus]|uniref:Uncharacterized protein n=1 Tax=Talaromyces islandicus TaxID=28573 RepID=A0A0U1LMC8_TALIS|nr:hypothetical protein PISL3812_01531 [Talaromyces islandicus]
MVNPGHFTYPPSNSHSDTKHYNYLDTVIVSWETLAQNVTPTYLSIYYYLNDGSGWKAGYNHSVPVNGSRNVDLNIIDGGYYGQFNLMYWLPDNGGLAKYLSEFFFFKFYYRERNNVNILNSHVYSGRNVFNNYVDAGSNNYYVSCYQWNHSRHQRSSANILSR